MSEWKQGEWVDYPLKKKRDGQTARGLIKITNGEGDNKPLYFNRPHFTGDGRHLVFLSNRTDSWQVFVCDLKGARICRITDCKDDPGYPSVDQNAPLVYYAEGLNIHRVDLDAMNDEIIYTHPHSDLNMFRHQAVSADGKHLGFVTIDRFEGDDIDESVGMKFQRRYKAKPRTCFYIMSTDGANVWKAHQEMRYLYHLQFCPTDPSTLLYCHEGPVRDVQQRMWLMSWNGLDIRPLRTHHEPDVTIVHEYWLSDGKTVAYMYQCPSKNEEPSFRAIDVQSGEEKIVVTYPFHDIISDPSGRYIVGDDKEMLHLYDTETERMTPLAVHGQDIGMDNQPFHAHPGFSPDRKHVVFCINDEGANDVCLVDIEDLIQ